MAYDRPTSSVYVYDACTAPVGLALAFRVFPNGTTFNVSLH